MEIHFNKKRILLDVGRVSFFRRGIGLMFRTPRTENLLFEFRRDGNFPITSIFVFFPFLAVWLDSDNNVVDYSVVQPFRSAVYSKKNFRKLVEIPFNDDNRQILGFFVGEEKFK